MAGVAGPMLRTRRGAGTRLLAGLLAGELAAGAVLAGPAFLLGTALRDALPLQARLCAIAALCMLFAVADLANRTPQVQRQVPESLIWRLSPGTLGLAWGFDLGLLVTTQKAVSLIWAAITATVLLSPAAAAIVVIATPVIAGLTVIVHSLARRPGGYRLASWGHRLRLARRGSGAVLAALGVLTAVQAWHA
jgi:hypothetical protein